MFQPVLADDATNDSSKHYLITDCTMAFAKDAGACKSRNGRKYVGATQDTGVCE